MRQNVTRSSAAMAAGIVPRGSGKAGPVYGRPDAAFAIRTAGRMPDRCCLDPAALGGDQDGLRPVHRAELGVGVVEMRADRARREVELVRDLLVDLALGQAL